ncbi:hypothetical protein DLJ48_06585 [Oenococcus sicerae]|uniref:Uncharacterized protein n=2 Tax=Oenococcus sicerae TaxID=2203724 RepID=A0AAJ1RB20_9LACO|nr:hypothetical protein [Oenococcus sicerae]MDN6899517.1 hypothetical protein [Oenococcus sicerae]QAS70211.1 hypothetical protein DLJ48_06585 [Oenococcus sicerae]VDK14005.1 hypothetical protein OAL24_00802 [Oenococcus sicerae]
MAILNTQQIVVNKIRDVVLLTHDVNINDFYRLRFDDLLKISGLDEKELIRVLMIFQEQGLLDFHSQVDSAGRMIHDEYVLNTFRLMNAKRFLSVRD